MDRAVTAGLNDGTSCACVWSQGAKGPNKEDFLEERNVEQVCKEGKK